MVRVRRDDRYNVLAVTMTSREWEIDQQIRRLVRKMVEGTISTGEIIDLQYLQRERVELMKPVALRKR